MDVFLSAFDVSKYGWQRIATRMGGGGWYREKRREGGELVGTSFFSFHDDNRRIVLLTTQRDRVQHCNHYILESFMIVTEGRREASGARCTVHCLPFELEGNINVNIIKIISGTYGGPS